MVGEDPEAVLEVFDVRDDYLSRRSSSSAAKGAEAVRKISLARRSLAFSRLSLRSSRATSLEDTPGGGPCRSRPVDPAPHGLGVDFEQLSDATPRGLQRLFGKPAGAGQVLTSDGRRPRTKRNSVPRRCDQRRGTKRCPEGSGTVAEGPAALRAISPLTYGCRNARRLPMRLRGGFPAGTLRRASGFLRTRVVDNQVALNSAGTATVKL